MNTPKRPRVEGFVRVIETTPPLEVAPEQEEPFEQEGHSGMETTPKRPRVEGFVRAIETTPPLEVAPEQEEPLEQEGHSGMETTPKRPRVEGFVRAIETTPPLEVAPEQEEPLEQEGHSGMETTPKWPRVKGFVRAIETTPPLEVAPEQEEPLEQEGHSGMETTPKRPRGPSLHARLCGEKESGDTARDVGANTLVNGTVMNPSVNDVSSVSLRENSQQNLMSVETCGGFLAHMQSIVAHKFHKLMASILYDSAGRALLEIKHQEVHYHPPAGFVHRI